MPGIEKQRLVEDDCTLDREAQPARVSMERPALAPRHAARAQRVDEDERTAAGEIEEAPRAEPGAGEANGGVRDECEKCVARHLGGRLARAATGRSVDARRSLRSDERSGTAIDA